MHVSLALFNSSSCTCVLMACFGVWIRAVCLCDVGVVFAHVHSVTSCLASVCVCVCSVSTPVCVCGYLWLDNEGLEGAGGKMLIYFSSY